MRKQLLYIVESLTDAFGAVIPKGSLVMDNTTKALYQISVKGTTTDTLTNVAKTSLVVSIPSSNVTDLGTYAQFEAKLLETLT